MRPCLPAGFSSQSSIPSALGPRSFAGANAYQASDAASAWQCLPIAVVPVRTASRASTRFFIAGTPDTMLTKRNVVPFRFSFSSAEFERAFSPGRRLPSTRGKSTLDRLAIRVAIRRSPRELRREIVLSPVITAAPLLGVWVFPLPYSKIEPPRRLTGASADRPLQCTPSALAGHRRLRPTRTLPRAIAPAEGGGWPSNPLTSRAAS